MVGISLLLNITVQSVDLKFHLIIGTWSIWGLQLAILRGKPNQTGCYYCDHCCSTVILACFQNCTRLLRSRFVAHSRHEANYLPSTDFPAQRMNELSRKKRWWSCPYRTDRVSLFSPKVSLRNRLLLGLSTTL